MTNERNDDGFDLDALDDNDDGFPALTDEVLDHVADGGNMDEFRVLERGQRELLDNLQATVAMDSNGPAEEIEVVYTFLEWAAELDHHAAQTGVRNQAVEAAWSAPRDVDEASVTLAKDSLRNQIDQYSVAHKDRPEIEEWFLYRVRQVKKSKQSTANAATWQIFFEGKDDPLVFNNAEELHDFEVVKRKWSAEYGRTPYYAQNDNREDAWEDVIDDLQQQYADDTNVETVPDEAEAAIDELYRQVRSMTAFTTGKYAGERTQLLIEADSGTEAEARQQDKLWVPMDVIRSIADEYDVEASSYEPFRQALDKHDLRKPPREATNKGANVKFWPLKRNADDEFDPEDADVYDGFREDQIKDDSEADPLSEVEDSTDPTDATVEEPEAVPEADPEAVERYAGDGEDDEDEGAEQ